MTGQTRHIAVLTGDLVASTELGPDNIERAFTALRQSAEDQAGWTGNNLHFSRHRGDGWQVVLWDPERALRAALTFRAALRVLGPEFDSYMAIATGPVTTPIASDLNRQTDEVFAASGRTIDTLKERARKTGIRILHDDQGYFAAASLLADHISQSWTPAQASAILPFLDPDEELTDTEVAAGLGKSRQSVSKSLKAAGKDVIQRALFYIEAAARADAEAQV